MAIRTPAMAALRLSEYGEAASIAQNTRKMIPAIMFTRSVMTANPQRLLRMMTMFLRVKPTRTRSVKNDCTIVATPSSNNTELTSSGNRPGPVWVKCPIGYLRAPSPKASAITLSTTPRARLRSFMSCPLFVRQLQSTGPSPLDRPFEQCGASIDAVHELAVRHGQEQRHDSAEMHAQCKR